MRVDLSPLRRRGGLQRARRHAHEPDDDARRVGCAPVRLPARRRLRRLRHRDRRDNLLGKRTVATREKSLRHLRELYALRASVPLFGALRLLWRDDPTSRPLLALMCAAARDPLVRCGVELVHGTAIGTSSARTTSPMQSRPHSRTASLPECVTASDATSPARGPRAATSLPVTRWPRRSRTRVTPSPASATYALYLGHLDGFAGPALFVGTWADILDAEAQLMQAMAEVAARSGWLDYAAAGGMLQVGFGHLDDVLRGEDA